MAIFGLNFPGFNRRKATHQGATVNQSRNGKGPIGHQSVDIKRKPEPAGLGELIKQMDSDYQVTYARGVLAANIASIQVNVTIEGGDERHEAVRESLQSLWDRHVTVMQDSIGYGRVAFEKCWEFIPEHGVHVVKKLDAHDFSETKMRLTDQGKYDGFDLKNKEGNWDQVTSENSWWLALFPTKKEPHGRSQYLGAVLESWRRKAANLKNRDKFSRRFAIRGGVAHIPMTEVDEQTGQIYSVPEKIASALDALYSGGTLMLPNDSHPQVDGKYKYDFSEANAENLDPGPIDSIIENDDVAILRSFVIPEKTVTEGGSTGSFAMVSQQMLTLFARVESLLGEMVESFKKYVVKKTFEMNFGEMSGVKFDVGFTRLTNRPDSLVAELLKTLVANPQFATVLVSGGIDMRQLLTTLGLPVSDVFDDLIQSVAARYSATMSAISPAGQPAAALATDGGGEFSGMARRGWQNNRKAIEDIRNELVDGTASEGFARTMLSTLGLSAAAIDVLIADAIDGKNDEPLDVVAIASADDVKKK